MARSLSGTDESASSFDRNKLITQTILHSRVPYVCYALIGKKSEKYHNWQNEY